MRGRLQCHPKRREKQERQAAWELEEIHRANKWGRKRYHHLRRNAVTVRRARRHADRRQPSLQTRPAKVRKSIPNGGPLETATINYKTEATADEASGSTRLHQLGKPNGQYLPQRDQERAHVHSGSKNGRQHGITKGVTTRDAAMSETSQRNYSSPTSRKT